MVERREREGEGEEGRDEWETQRKTDRGTEEDTQGHRGRRTEAQRKTHRGTEEDTQGHRGRRTGAQRYTETALFSSLPQIIINNNNIDTTTSTITPFLSALPPSSLLSRLGLGAFGRLHRSSSFGGIYWVRVGGLVDLSGILFLSFSLSLCMVVAGWLSR